MTSETEPAEDEQEIPEQSSDPIALLDTKRTQQKAILLMIFMVVGLNSAWFFAQSLSSDVEVNRVGAGFKSSHSFEVPNMMLMSRKVPTSINCNFLLDPQKEANSTEVSWRLTDSRGVLIHSWSGEVGDDCGVELMLEPGIHRISTTVPVGVNAEQTVHMQVWKSLSYYGHITATLLAFLFPLPALLTSYRRRPSTTQSAPLARMRRYEDWQAIHREMEERDRSGAEVADLNPFTGGTALVDRSFKPQPIQKEQVAEAKIAPDIPEVDQTDLIEDMDEDTMHGLVEPLAADKRIQKVADIYDLMKEDR